MAKKIYNTKTGVYVQEQKIVTHKELHDLLKDSSIWFSISADGQFISWEDTDLSPFQITQLENYLGNL